MLYRLFLLCILLILAANVLDIENDILQFKLGELKSGSLIKNGSIFTDGEILLAPGEALSWIPKDHAHGTIQAFTISAFDGNSNS
jgi:hypothetical protein